MSPINSYTVLNDLTGSALDVICDRGCRVETRLTPFTTTYRQC